MNRLKHTAACALALSAAAIALAGCASPQEIARMDERTCSGYGFAKGTDAFAGCMQRVARDRRRSADATFNGAPSAGDLSRPAAVAAPSRPPATTTDCKVEDQGTSTTSGNSTTSTAGSSASSGNSGSFSGTTTRSGSSTTTSSSSGTVGCVTR